MSRSSRASSTLSAATSAPNTNTNSTQPDDGFFTDLHALGRLLLRLNPDHLTLADLDALGNNLHLLEKFADLRQQLYNILHPEKAAAKKAATKRRWTNRMPELRFYGESRLELEAFLDNLEVRFNMFPDEFHTRLLRVGFTTQCFDEDVMRKWTKWRIAGNYRTIDVSWDMLTEWLYSIVPEDRHSSKAKASGLVTSSRHKRRSRRVGRY